MLACRMAVVQYSGIRYSRRRVCRSGVGYTGSRGQRATSGLIWGFKDSRSVMGCCGQFVLIILPANPTLSEMILSADVP